jgi:mRNA-degrading endonuclease toxin of MazEF toxin-antitoxin module
VSQATWARRGEVWIYQPVVTRSDSPDYRLIVSSDVVNEAVGIPTVLIVRVVPEDPGGLLSVRVAPFGWALALTIQPVVRSRLTQPVARVDDDVMDQLATALRVVMEL